MSTQELEKITIRHNNRLAATSPKKVTIYCPCCDRSLLRPGLKCPVCHNRIYSTHRKR